MTHRFALLAALLLSCATELIAADGEVLYNGIRLSKQWPPRDEFKMESREPQPVPYLATPPTVIPIDVGRQLFVDDFLISSTTLKRVFHRAHKYDGNPILKPETPLEAHGRYVNREEDAAATACPFDDGVFYDPADHLFKMTYMAGFYRNTCLATSADGLHWTRPNLDIEPGTNNIIPFSKDFIRDAFSPWMDLTATDASERWKAFLYARYHNPGDLKGHGGSWLYTSPDGIHWQQRDKIKPEVGDNTTIFYNPFRKKWVMSVRRNAKERGRARFYYEADTFFGLAKMKSDDPVFWSGTDELDLPDTQIQRQTQLYCLSPVAYESIMLGAFAIHYGPENGDCDKGKFPKLTEIELGYSRDGFHFSRPDRTSFIAATKRDGDWDRAYLRPAGSVCNIVGDKLFFYYCGFSGVAPDGQRHFYAGGSTHVAFLRRDGFASMNADAQGGELTTAPVVFNGKFPFVNVWAKEGELRAEILDIEGKVIAPFSKEKSVPVKTDSTKQRLVWQGVDDLSALVGKPVRFRFHLTNGHLYSFWVSAKESGVSRGYVAAGGPDFKGPIDE